MNQPSKKYTPVKGAPVKSFFVTMLTRDIDLEDAILDLLDNCVDGILRNAPDLDVATPYAGKYASIEIGDDSFTIYDNCGGIPWSLCDYAFRMGRADDRPPELTGAVGVYGIGMKRAIFKMGKDCLISTQNSTDRYEVHISREWLKDDGNWDIPVDAVAKTKDEDGTTIVVCDLYDDIQHIFSHASEAFRAGLETRIATHYAYILSKGFKVRINDVTVTPHPTKFIFSDLEQGTNVVRPYMFTTKTDDVEIFLTVGFTRPIPTPDESTSEDNEKLYSSEQAGWTVLCNDRAVLFCDKSALTGWGEARVPRYHTQFIAIAGIVEFRSLDPGKLPTTTTKRGIDASSSLYLSVKNKMREGMGYFTDFTYKWKGREQEARTHILKGQQVTFDEIKARASAMRFAETRKTALPGRQYRPHLPMPPKLKPAQRRISFIRNADDIKAVGRYLLNDDSVSAAKVGEECFDTFLSEVKS